MRRTTSVAKATLFSASMMLLFCQSPFQLAAQQPDPASPIILSSDSLFAEDIRAFGRSDTLFIKVILPHIDYFDLKENEYNLISHNGKEDRDGKLTNHLNGVFSTKIPLSKLRSSETLWRLVCQIEDDSGVEFEADLGLRISDGDGFAEVTLAGLIDSVGTESLTVAGRTVFTTGETKIVDKRGDRLSFFNLLAGQQVEISAVPDSLGAFAATKIIVQTSDVENEIEITGTIQGLVDSTISLGSLIFHINRDSRFHDQDNDAISFADLAIGQIAEMKAHKKNDSTLVADKVKLEDDENEEVEVVGPIEAITDSTLTANGVPMRVLSNIMVFDEDDETSHYGVLALGFDVEIKAEKGTDGAITALVIEIKKRTIAANQFVLKGEIETLTSDSLVVSGFDFSIDSTTVFVDERGRPFDITVIDPGRRVEIQATVRISGGLVATIVLVKDVTFDNLEVAGQIDSLQAQVVFVQGIPFTVSDSTVIADDDGSPASFFNLIPGMKVDVCAQILPQGFNLATEIEIVDAVVDPVELTGTIDQIGGDSLVVSGATFFFDANTLVFDHTDNTLTVMDLANGEIVEIIAVRQPDGRLLATQIKLLQRIEDEIEVVGMIEAINDSTITVLGEGFVVTANTETIDSQGAAISLADLSVGQTVQIRGDLLPGNTRIAQRIKLRDEAKEITVVGPIDSLSTSEITVLGIAFMVDDSTEIVNDDGDIIALDSLRVGQTVEVTGVDELDGTRRAKRVELEDVMVLFGKIDQVDENSAVVASVSFMLSPDVLVINENNLLESRQSLQRDQILEVHARKQVDKTLLATRVKIHGLSSVSSVQVHDAIVPSTFALGNYPNPFNPETTIRFEIPFQGKKIGTVELAIFNVRGQRVQTLVDQPLRPGVHVRIWDGRDANGKPAPSGIYAYRLTVDGVKVGRTMTLLK